MMVFALENVLNILLFYTITHLSKGSLPGTSLVFTLSVNSSFWFFRHCLLWEDIPIIQPHPHPCSSLNQDLLFRPPAHLVLLITFITTFYKMCQTFKKPLRKWVIQLTTSQLKHALSPFLSQDLKKYFLEMTFTPSSLLIILKEV